MKLVVFDLDGTLTRTFSIDEQCFVQAFSIALQIETVDTNWIKYRHVSDLGIMWEVFREHYGRDPKPGEVSSFVECFVSLLRLQYSMNAASFGETPGAAALLHSLRRHPQWQAAIATGAFERSARLKITAAGIQTYDFPMAFAEHGPARETIVEAAIRKASASHPGEFEKVVLVGDASWDVRTAKRLGFRFVGVAQGDRAKTLLTIGASHVVPDFLNHVQCYGCLEEATIPATEVS